jgi:hypothetical protein
MTLYPCAQHLELPDACFLNFDTIPDYFALMLTPPLDSAIISSRPIIIAPQSLTEVKRDSGINTSGRRDRAQVAMWSCLYPPSWSLIRLKGLSLELLDAKNIYALNPFSTCLSIKLINRTNNST